MPVVSGNVEEEHKDSLDDMADNGPCSSRSEAVARAVDAGLAELGYADGAQRETGLREIVQQAYRGSLWALVLLLGLTWLGPVESRLVVLALTPIPAALWALDRALHRVEPRATRLLVTALGGGAR